MPHRKFLNVFKLYLRAEIVNMKKILFCLMIALLSGCGALRTIGVPLERVPLNLSEPTPLQLNEVEFIVIHKDNAAAAFAELEKSGVVPVVFALTGSDYKALAINVSDIKEYIVLQRKIIRLYKNYYEKGE